MALGDKLPVVMGKEKAVAGGVATLGPDGVLSEEQRPFVDAVPTKGSSSPVQSGGVYSALSNKVSKSSDTPCPNLDEFVELYQYVNVTPDTENLPAETNLDFGSAINIGLSSGVMIQILYSRYGDIFVRGYAYWEIPKWKPWVPIVTATPPQEYPLPLTEGFTPITPCTYRKNQFSEVFVGGSTGGTITDGTVIATLPEGFRPKQTVERPATFAVSGSQAAGSVTIMPDGNVSVHGQSAASGVVFSANFVVDE